MTDNFSEISMAIIKRVGEQYEFKDAWKTMLNAERSELLGDIYNIVKEAKNGL